MPLSAYAVDQTWTGGAGTTTFSNPLNWSPIGGVGDGDTATITSTAPNGNNVRLTGNTAGIDGLTLIDNGRLFTNGSQLFVDDSTPAGIFTLFNTSTTTVENGGDLVINSGAISGMPVPDAHLDNLVVGDQGLVRLTNGSSLAPPSTLQTDRTLSTDFSGFIESGDGRIVLGEQLNNNGVIDARVLSGPINPAVNLTIDPLSGSSLVGVDLDGSDETGLVLVNGDAVMRINAPLNDSVDNQVFLGEDARLEIAENMNIGSTQISLGRRSRLDVGRQLTLGLSTGGTPADVSLDPAQLGLSTTAGMIRVGRGGASDVIDPFRDNGLLISDPDAGHAVARIEGGATLDAQTVFSNIQNFTTVRIGTELGESGRLEVDGPGSRLTTNGIMVGGLGEAELSVTNGGVIDTFGSVFIGENLSSTAPRSNEAVIDGVGSQWLVGGRFLLGMRDGTTSHVFVRNGGLLDVTDDRPGLVGGSLGIGENPGSEGQLSVDGPGSTVLVDIDLTLARDILANGSGSGTLNITNGGRVEVGDDVQVGNDFGASWAEAELNILSGGMLEVADQFRATRDSVGSGSSTVNLNNGTLVAGGSVWIEDLFATAGMSLISAGSRIDLRPTGVSEINGTLELGGGADAEFRGNNYTGDGTIRNLTGNRLFLGNSLDLNTVSVENRGWINLNYDSAGHTTLQDFSQTSTGEFFMDTFTGGSSDLLEVSGSASLDGAIVLASFSGQIEPLPYESIAVIVAAGGINGTFAEVVNPLGHDYLGADEAIAVTYSATQVLLTRALYGDANLDGFISQSDLDAVLLNWGSTGATWATGDLSGDGFVSQADLDAVLLNWGSGTPPSVAAIPEPAAGLLLLAGVWGVRRADCRHG